MDNHAGANCAVDNWRFWAPGAHNRGMNEPITARSATDMLSLVPHLLGFHIDEGVVVVVCQQRAVEVTMRFDHEMFEHPLQVQSRLLHLSARFQTPRLFRVSPGERDQSDPALAILEQALEPEQVIDSVHTDGQHWWSRLCDQDCCQRVACDDATAVAASAIMNGSNALSSRGELERLVHGPSLVTQSQMLGAYQHAREVVDEMDDPKDRGERVLQLIDEGLSNGWLSGQDACELALLVAEIAPRDEAWREMGLSSAREHVALWQQVVALVPDAWAVPPLCLLAAAAWLDGNGALMGCAVARAEHLDPDYSMLDLLQEIHVAAAPPSLWHEMWQAS